MKRCQSMSTRGGVRTARIRKGQGRGDSGGRGPRTHTRFASLSTGMLSPDPSPRGGARLFGNGLWANSNRWRLFLINAIRHVLSVIEHRPYLERLVVSQSFVVSGINKLFSRKERARTEPCVSRLNPKLPHRYYSTLTGFASSATKAGIDSLRAWVDGTVWALSLRSARVEPSQNSSKVLIRLFLLEDRPVFCFAVGGIRIHWALAFRRALARAMFPRHIRCRFGSLWFPAPTVDPHFYMRRTLPSRQHRGRVHGEGNASRAVR